MTTNENDKSGTKYNNEERCDSRCCKRKFLCFWIPILVLGVLILAGPVLAYIAIFKQSMKIENLVLPAIVIVSAIVSALIALKLIKPFAKMAFLGKIMQCSKCMICCDLCNDDNSNKNQTQGDESKEVNTGKNEDEPSNIAKAKLDAEKDLIKKFCDTLVEL